LWLAAREKADLAFDHHPFFPSSLRRGAGPFTPLLGEEGQGVVR